MSQKALSQLQRYCAYQDRCHAECRTKLIELGVYGETLEEILSALIQENYLNEERFACSYARGKFRMKQWGRIRILRELQQRKISAYCIKKAMTEINDDEYIASLNDLIEKYQRTHPDVPKNHKLQKTVQYLLLKGYESELVWQYANAFFAPKTDK